MDFFVISVYFEGKKSLEFNFVEPKQATAYFEWKREGVKKKIVWEQNSLERQNENFWLH